MSPCTHGSSLNILPAPLPPPPVGMAEPYRCNAPWAINLSCTVGFVLCLYPWEAARLTCHITVSLSGSLETSKEWSCKSTCTPGALAKTNSLIGCIVENQRSCPFHWPQWQTGFVALTLCTASTWAFKMLLLMSGGNRIEALAGLSIALLRHFSVSFTTSS